MIEVLKKREVELIIVGTEKITENVVPADFGTWKKSSGLIFFLLWNLLHK